MVSKEFLLAVEPPGVGAGEPLHPGHQVGLGRLDGRMKMIGRLGIRQYACMGERTDPECVDFGRKSVFWSAGAFVRNQCQRRHPSTHSHKNGHRRIIVRAVDKWPESDLVIPNVQAKPGQ